MQSLFSHSDKSPKQTKTQTTQQGSHHQKSPRPEVIRSYSNEKTLHETVQSVLTLVNFKYMLVCICIFKNSGLVLCLLYTDSLDQNFQRLTKIFCKCSEKYGHEPINFGASIIRTVVRIVGMGRMSHICNTKCSRLQSCSRKYLSLETCLEALSDSILTAHKRKTHRNFPERQ